MTTSGRLKKNFKYKVSTTYGWRPQADGQEKHMIQKVCRSVQIDHTCGRFLKIKVWIQKAAAAILRKHVLRNQSAQKLSQTFRPADIR